MRFVAAPAVAGTANFEAAEEVAAAAAADV